MKSLDPGRAARPVTAVARFVALAVLAASWFAVAPAFADTGSVQNSVDNQAVPKRAETLVKRLKKARPDLPIQAVLPTPIKGLYGLEMPGGSMLYGTEDGRYLISGDMYEIGDELVNLAEVRRSEQRKKLLDLVPREQMVVFSPKGKTRAHVNVFTDVDCGYCRKLHQEMAQINDLGIEVRYLAYPRSGIGTESYRKIVSAWCAHDQNQAMTNLKAGVAIPSAECTNPVAEQYELGRQIGISGTPAIVTADGRLLPGYMPAAALAKELGL